MPPKIHNVAEGLRWKLYFLAILALCVVAIFAAKGALESYSRPLAGIFVDPDGVVSSAGLPTWDGIKKGLHFPDRIVEVDGVDLAANRNDLPGDTFDRAVERAASDGQPSVHVRVQTQAGMRDLDLAVEPISSLAWWLNAGSLIIIGVLYGLAAVIALSASPNGRLSKTFAKTAFYAALLLLTFFDFQTRRSLVPGFYLAFSMVSMGFVALPLRLPDDVPLLVRYPWLVRVLDGAGLSLVLAMFVRHWLGLPTTALQQVCTLMFGASQFFFVTAILVRFVRARGERRDTLRMLIGAMLVAHVPVGVVVLSSMVSSRGSTVAFFVIPVLALSPLSTFVAFVRHDLWKSRALLSRVLTRSVIATMAGAVAVALGAALAASLGVPFGAALLSATIGGSASAALVLFALRATDRNFFPSRSEYKPTIEQLSEDLTSMSAPSEVATAVERTVRRWLACERVVFVALPMCSPTDAPDSHPSAVGTEGAELSLPARFGDATLGMLHVGKKRGGALFTSDDLDLLRTIANQAALALAYARSYAELEERRQQQAAAWREERTALVETVAAEIAHEVRYPINFFRSVFKRGTADGKLDNEAIEIGCEEVDRLERLVSGLRRVVAHRMDRRVVDLTHLAARAEVLLRDALGKRALELAIPSGSALRCDPDQSTQILVNLLSNALDAVDGDGRVGLSWKATERGGELMVWDSGPGFSGDAAQLFAPWFTTKPRGTGLGLAITQRIVRAHGWSIDAKREQGRTVFVIAVPASDVLDLVATGTRARTDSRRAV